MQPYRTLNEYYRTLFGGKVAKIAIDAGFTCPNRDGTLGQGGCIFCSERGSGDFAEQSTHAISEQIWQGRSQTSEKWIDVVGYIAYFQAFTNTYAPVETLRKRYYQALNNPDIVGLSIATRPDCLPEDVLHLLSEVSSKTKLWVELGFQTSNENTAQLIHRGYKNEVFSEAVFSLHRRQIPVVAHVIIGLPNETAKDTLHTILYLNTLPIQGVKIHLLHVLAHTKLAALYENHTYSPLSMDTYLETLCLLIAHLREDIVIHRLTGDGNKDILLAPLWSLNKRNVLNTFHRMLKERNITQGQALKNK